MPIRQLSTEQIERLRLLHQLSDDIIVPTRDAWLLAGVGSSSTWQRLRAKGRTPSAHPLNGSTDGFRCGECRGMRGHVTTPAKKKADAPAA